MGDLQKAGKYFTKNTRKNDEKEQSPEITLFARLYDDYFTKLFFQL